MCLAPIINPLAYSPIADILRFNWDIANRALLGTSISLWVFSLIWFFRPKINGSSIWQSIKRELPDNLRFPTNKLYTLILFSLIALSILFFASSQYINFRYQVVSFMLGQLSPSEYRYARRLDYAESVLIMDVIGRLRYSIFPPLFAFCVTFLSVKRGMTAGFILGLILFTLLPASLSKLPFVTYLAYFFLIYLAISGKIWILKSNVFILSSIAGFFFVILMLGGLYFVQYPNLYQTISDFPKALDLALYRTAMNLYAAYLAHFKVYPGKLDFTGFSSISMLNFITGSVRNIDLEVAAEFVGISGARFTSFPTTFIGAAYASFGYLGIIIFSVIVALYLIFLDQFATRLRNPIVRLSYLSTIMVNATFLNHLPAPPVFITYGLILIPATTWAVDRWIASLTHNKDIRTNKIRPGKV